ncbi:MAG TPA: nodulation protein NfeD [Flavisolibacter sp.]|nr:nodulation protein NfeD [Flavisolibacter sp.]
MVKWLYLLLFSTVHFFVSAQKVISITIDGTINPASASFIKRSITKATEENAECLLIKLNTPGGLLKSTRVIAGDILQSAVPVVVYVWPAGAHAGSAGVFVTLAAHIAAMAPGTNIGAAHPVSAQGGLDTTMDKKATNDAVAFVRTLAEKRNRNIEWAEDAVRKSASISASDAVTMKVIDLVSPNTKDLLQKINGRTVEIPNGTATLRTSNASVQEMEMGFMEKLLNIISNPNVAYILMMLGFYGLFFELSSPGAIFPGVVGVICLILAFYAMHTLPINYAGLGLIIFGLILLLLEIKVTSGGLLAIGGVLSLLLGSFMLIDPDKTIEVFKISRTVIVATTAVTAFFFLILVGYGLKAQKGPTITGIDGMKGQIGVVLERLQPSGSILVQGEIWKAQTAGGVIEEGKNVRVIEVKNFIVLVEPV